MTRQLPGSSPPPAPATTFDGAGWFALHHGAVLCRLERVGGLRVSGDDRIEFLHGQLAADIRGLAIGGAGRSLALDVKGHALAEATVHRREHDLYLAVEDGASSLLRERLRRHVIFDAVRLEDLSGDLGTLTLQGPGAAEAIAAAGWAVPTEGRFVTVAFGAASLLIAPRARSAAGGFDLHLLRGRRDDLLGALDGAGVVPADENVLEPSRVAAGLARAGREAGAGILPHEAGLNDAFSTRKGCYLGQEVMARIEARGRLHRALAGLHLYTASDAGAGAAHGAEGRGLLLNGRRVGRIGTVAWHPRLGSIALAVLRLDVGDEPLEIEERPHLGARRAPLPFPLAHEP